MTKATIKLDVEGYGAEVLGGGRDVLAAPTLIAVEAEWPDDATSGVLTAAGFINRWYDPWSRTLLEPQSANNPNASNALFVRDEPAILNRLRSAPRRRIQGQNL